MQPLGHSAAVTRARANRNSIELSLRKLVASGRLRLQGRGPGSWYQQG